MPVPQGDITTTEIIEPKQSEEKKKYRVQLIVKRRVVVNVKATDEEDACMVAQDVYSTGDNSLYDEFLLGPDAEVEEIKE